MIVILSLICIMPFLISIFMCFYERRKNTKKEPSARSGRIERQYYKNMLFFGLYLSILFYFTIASRAASEKSPGLIFSSNVSDINEYLNLRVNLEPFATVFRIIDGWRNGYVTNKMFVYNIVFNILMLAPIAYFYSKLSRRGSSGLFFLIIFTAALFIETAQLVSMTGSFDIDDIILNVAGAAAVYFLFFMKKRKKKKKNNGQVP